MTDRNRIITRAVLTELKRRPAHFPYPDKALFSAVRLSVYPEPDEAEYRELMNRLENDGYILRDDTGLDGRRYTITGAGRSYLADR